MEIDARKLNPNGKMVFEGRLIFGYAYTNALEGIPFTLGPAAYGSFRECLLPEGRSPQ